MKAYRVIRTCTFRRRYLEKDTIVEYPDDVKVPHHMVPLKKEGQPESKKEEPQSESYSGLQGKSAAAQKPKSGFAHSFYKDKKKRGKAQEKK